MLSNLKKEIEKLLKISLEEVCKTSIDPALLVLEKPKEKIHGEFSCSAALRLVKVLKKSPKIIAQEVAEVLEQNLEKSSLKEKIKSIEVKNPGFINFFLANIAFCDVLSDVLNQGDQYGRSTQGKGNKIQIEFVSANPTGPLTVAHARQAAVGDALGNILGFLGYDIKKEYYINDEGNQIKILGGSINARAAEILGETVDFPEDYYQGAYIKRLAKDFMKERNICDVQALEAVPTKDFEKFGVKVLLDEIKQDLEDFNVHFDVWSSQTKIATPKSIEDALKVIEEKGYLYEKDGATWFKSTDLGDDKDRVVKKSDGNYTYLAPDIAYHKDKFDRGFNRVINILGPDHHGYIARLKAAVEALGHSRDDVEVLIVQLASLYRKGQPLSMSTRKGEFISLRQVMQDVGFDAARFFFLMRHIKVHLDFDLELAKEQSPENPVYYIQYAHARINSIFTKAKEANLKIAEKDFTLLQESEEIDLIQKMASFEDALSICLGQLDPFGMVTYLIELAACFHRFYDKHKVIGEDQALSCQRLALIEAARIVFHNGLTLLGVSAPKKM
ncbi:MAG: arginine--tRNA ligase [Candidatus Aceula meridiana]|nr:arginine--tRNA ligase [Candidatus Aceula meridiana]